MYSSTQLGRVMETSCDECRSRFRLTEKQLKQAYGKVCCGECGHVFNAMIGLKSYEGELAPDYLEQLRIEEAESAEDTATELEFDSGDIELERPELSLHEAMYGSRKRSFFSIAPLTWLIGILILGALGVAQAFYYQRYELIEDPRFQQQVIHLCRVLPCAEHKFSSTEQIRLLDRNIFTHPVTTNALMITGSFVNQAPFTQKLPELLISLFDVQGKLIANRVFYPTEYLLEATNQLVIEPDQPVQFRLEIVDPGTEALTYEFEFF